MQQIQYLQGPHYSQPFLLFYPISLSYCPSCSTTTETITYANEVLLFSKNDRIVPSSSSRRIISRSVEAVLNRYEEYLPCNESMGSFHKKVKDELTTQSRTSIINHVIFCFAACLVVFLIMDSNLSMISVLTLVILHVTYFIVIYNKSQLEINTCYKKLTAVDLSTLN